MNTKTAVACYIIGGLWALAAWYEQEFLFSRVFLVSGWAILITIAIILTIMGK